MRVSVAINSSGSHGIGKIALDLPDDYEVGPRLWSDLQDLIFEKIKAAKESGTVVDFISGVDGDKKFQEKMEAKTAR